MKRKNIQNSYFGPVEEAAVLAYNKEKCPEKKNQIFQDALYKPMLKLAENIFNMGAYDFVEKNDGGSKEAIQSGLTFLATKVLPKVKQNRGKAYSLFSVSLRRYYVNRNKYLYQRAVQDIPIDGFTTNNNIDTLFSKSPADLIEFLPELRTEDQYHSNTNVPEFLKLCTDYFEEHKKKYCKNPRQEKIMLSVLKLMKEETPLEFSLIATGKHAVISAIRKETGLRPAQFYRYLLCLGNIRNKLWKEYNTYGTIKGFYEMPIGIVTKADLPK